MIGEQERLLARAEQPLVSAGTPQWWNAGPGDALLSVEMRPGLQIDQAATDAWADKWEDEHRPGGQHVGLISSLRVGQFRLWSPMSCEAAPAASATRTGSSLAACRH